MGRDVLPALAALGAVIGGMVALARLARPWMREAAREAASEVSAEVKALAEKLATNDFPHMEARIERGLQDVGERIDRVDARIGERLDRARQERRDMEARILAAVRRSARRDSEEPR